MKTSNFKFQAWNYWRLQVVPTVLFLFLEGMITDLRKAQNLPAKPCTNYSMNGVFYGPIW